MDFEIKLFSNDTVDFCQYKAAINAFVNTSPAAHIYHLPECCELLRSEFGHDYYYFIAIQNTGIVGILPLIRQKSRLFGDHFISMPFFNYGGIVAVTPEIEEQLKASAIELARRLGIPDIELRELKRRKAMQFSEHKITMLLELQNEEALWQSLGAKVRAQIKRPTQLDIKSIIGKAELLDNFYSVFSRNMRDLGTPVYQKSFFKKLIAKLEPHVHLHVVTIGGKPVGAALILGFKQTAEIPWASTLREYNKYGVNMFLYWAVLKHVIQLGYRYFDFGRSSKDSGTYRFKKQWGAKPVQLVWNYWLAPGCEIPMNNPANKKYSLAIKIWRNLPLWVTNWLGPKLARYLP